MKSAKNAYPPARKWTQENWIPAKRFWAVPVVAAATEVEVGVEEAIIAAPVMPERDSEEGPEKDAEPDCCFCCSCERVEEVTQVEGRMDGRIIELDRVAAAALEALMV